MKRTDIKVGVEYAVRRGTFGSPARVVALGSAKVRPGRGGWSHTTGRLDENGAWYIKAERRDDGHAWFSFEAADGDSYVKPPYFICEWDEWERREAESHRHRLEAMEQATRAAADDAAIKAGRGCRSCAFAAVQCLASTKRPCPKVGEVPCG